MWPGAGLDALASKNVSTLATTGVGEKTNAAVGRRARADSHDLCRRGRQTAIVGHRQRDVERAGRGERCERSLRPIRSGRHRRTS